MAKKILLLGGSHGQLPAIFEAKRRGFYTILCDYLPDNPGQNHTDEYFCISTTDYEAVKACAEENNVDIILAYASDPAAPIASFAAEKLGLIGSSFDSVSLLSNKKQFRKFLKKHGFNTPRFVVTGGNITIAELSHLKKPWIVKPVDSSDTKGVTEVNSEIKLMSAVQKALKYSKSGQAIIEEFVDGSVANLHGDAFIHDGKMIFCMLGDRIFSSVSAPLKPSTELYPSRLPKKMVQQVEEVTADILRKCGFTFGAINIEARIDSNGDIYVMEIGPRAGGTLTPQTIAAATGFNMLETLFDLFENKYILQKEAFLMPTICFALHVNKWGIFERVNLSDQLKQYILEEHIYVNKGDVVKPYSEPGSLIGVLIFRFEDMAQAEEMLPGLYEEVIAGIELSQKRN